MTPARLSPSANGSIMPCSRAMRRIQRSDMTGIGTRLREGRGTGPIRLAQRLIPEQTEPRRAPSGSILASPVGVCRIDLAASAGLFLALAQVLAQAGRLARLARLLRILVRRPAWRVGSVG